MREQSWGCGEHQAGSASSLERKVERTKRLGWVSQSRFKREKENDLDAYKKTQVGSCEDRTVSGLTTAQNKYLLKWSSCFCLHRTQFCHTSVASWLRWQWEWGGLENRHEHNGRWNVLLLAASACLAPTSVSVLWAGSIPRIQT